MKRENAIVVIAAFLVLAVFTTVIWIGEANSAEQARIKRVEEALEKTAKTTGYESLGVIDGYAISKANGSIYSGPAIHAELARRAGIDLRNSWSFTFGEESGIELLRLVVYEGEQKEPIFQQNVERIYIYGLI